MKERVFKKGLMLVIVVLFLSTSAVPVVNSTSTERYVLNKETSNPTTSNTEELPDLVIEDIFLWPSDYPFTYHFECRVKNIGDAATPYHWSEVEISVRIYWLLFGKIPILPIFSSSHTYSIDVIQPGATRNLGVASCDSLPKFGSYRFYLTVNPHKTIEESDYDNNKYSEDWKVFLGLWKPIG